MKTYSLTRAQRLEILKKTDKKCHVCGKRLSLDHFEADHVKSRSRGGNNSIDNFLPACRTCNNYRWHYLPQEINWILKLGVWAKTEIQKGTTIGTMMGEKFITYETQRENRRKKSRVPSSRPHHPLK